MLSAGQGVAERAGRPADTMVRRPMNTTQLAAEAVRNLTHAANAELFERIVERIHRYFRRLLRNDQEAEECLQETLVLLVQSLREGKYDPDRSFNTWLWLKARSVFAQWCRKRERAQRHACEALTEDVPGGEDVLGQSERRLDAESVLDVVAARLGEEAYEAFLLYYEGGLTQSEVAEVVGRDAKTVRKRISDAHALISELLG